MAEKVLIIDDDSKLLKLLREYLEDNKILLGNSYETRHQFDVGDVVMVAVEEIWKHACKGGKKKYRYSIHKPRILTSKPATTSISHMEFDELSEVVQ